METKIKRIFLISLLTFFILGLVIGNVNARGNTFIISPMEEAREVVQLNPRAEVFGNVLVQNGSIDFYVTDPSGYVVFYYNHIPNTDFNFTALEKGDYTLHFANSLSTDVIVQLNYSIHHKVELQSTITYTFSQTATVVTPPSPVDWSSIIHLIRDLIIYSTTLAGILGFFKMLWRKISNFLKWLRWRKKYKKSRTPVVIVNRLLTS